MSVSKSLNRHHIPHLVFNCFRPIAICMRRSFIVHYCRHYSMMMYIIKCDCKRDEKSIQTSPLRELTSN